MKKWQKSIVLLGLFYNGVQFCNAQEVKDDPVGLYSWHKDSIVYSDSAVDVSAKFPGGDIEFGKFIVDHFVYPQRCKDSGINGNVIIRFMVDREGKISNIYAVEETKSCPEFTAEAVRMLKISPKWIPGMIKGRFVASWRVLPVSLKLNE